MVAKTKDPEPDSEPETDTDSEDLGNDKMRELISVVQLLRELGLNMDETTINTFTVESPRVVKKCEEIEGLLTRLKEDKEIVDAALGAARLDDEG